MEKLLAKSKDEGDKGGEEQDTEEAETVVQVFEYTVEQFQKRRRFLVADCEQSCIHVDVVDLDKQIEVQQEAKLSGLPASVRVNKADKKVKLAQCKVETMVGKQAKLEEDLRQLLAKIEGRKQGINTAKEELAEAAQQRDSLYMELRPAVDANAKVDNSVQDQLVLSGALSDEEFKSIGVGKEQVAAILKGMQVALAEKQKAAKEAEVARRKAEDMAAAKAAAEPAAPTSAAPRWEEVQDEDDDVQMDEQQIIEAMPGGADLDAEARQTFMQKLAKAVVRPGKKVHSKVKDKETKACTKR